MDSNKQFFGDFRSFSQIILLILANVLAVDLAKAEDKENGPEKITVTGSRIKRLSLEGPSPIEVIDREAIEQSGAATVGQLLSSLPSSSFGNFREQSGNTRAGSATADIHGLGAEYTLVLLDGERLPAETSLGAADINHIPVGMIERIEILKDSASAIYGADAISAVVNIVVRKKFEDSQVSLKQTYTGDKGGEKTILDYLYGTSGDKFSLTAGITLRHSEEMKEEDRELFNGSSTYSPWGSYKVGGVWRPSPDCPADRIVTQGSNQYCGRPEGYSYGISYIKPDVESITFMTRMDYDLGNDLSLFVNLRASEKKANYKMFTTAFGVNTEISSSVIDQSGVTLPGRSAGESITAKFILDDLGHRSMLISDTATGLTAGASGVFGDYDWNLALTTARAISDGETKNALDNKIWQEKVSNATGGDVKFFPFGNRDTSEITDIFATTTLKEVNDYQNASVDFSGNLVDSDFTSVDFNFGIAASGQVYDSKKDAKSTEIITTGYRINSAGGIGEGNRSVGSLFGELSSSLMSNQLELGLAGRYDSFSDFGSAMNPKIGFAYTPASFFKFRASNSTGFKAPSLDLIFQKSGGGFESAEDTIKCEFDKKTDPDPDSCNFAENFLVERVGNLDLAPETSRSWNAGMIFDFSDFDFSADYYRVHISDVIGRTRTDDILEKERQGNITDLSASGIQVLRDSEQRLIKIINPYQNLGEKQVSGVDLKLGTLYDWGSTRLSFHSEYNKTFYYRVRDFVSDPLENKVGKAGAPEWRMSNQLGAMVDDWKYNLAFTTIGPFEKNDETNYGNDVGGNPIYKQESFADVTTVHASATYQTFYDGYITLGVINLFNKIYGKDNSGKGNSQRRESFSNPSLHPVDGTEIWLKVSQRF